MVKPYIQHNWIREVVKSWPCEWAILIEDDKWWNKWKSCEKWEFFPFIMSHNVMSPVKLIIQECFRHNACGDNNLLIIWMSTLCQVMTLSLSHCSPDRLQVSLHFWALLHDLQSMCLLTLIYNIHGYINEQTYQSAVSGKGYNTLFPKRNSDWIQPFLYRASVT